MYIHWSQEMFDQGGMVREFVKWDYEIRDASQLEQALDRALAIAMTEPRGPVYLTLPREMLASPMPADPGIGDTLVVPSPPAPAPVAVGQLVSLLGAAAQPIIVASDAGLHADDRQALADFADRHAIGVVEANRALTSNLDAEHPCHLGYDVQTALTEADLIVVCGAVVPWIPAIQQPRAGCRVVHVGPDPLFATVPFRAFPADLHITTGYRLLWEALAASLRDADHPPDLDARRSGLARLRAAFVDRASARAAAARDPRPHITKAWASAALSRAMPAHSIVVNEYWHDRELAPTRGHGSYFYQSPAGGLGWGVPAALGVKAAQPDRPVIATVGDGAYVFANPAACHHAAANQRLPILVAVYNNGRWGAVDAAARQVYDDLPAGTDGALPLSDLGQLPDFAAYARASGGHGETVSSPDALEAGLRRCFEAIARGQHALIDIMGR